MPKKDLNQLAFSILQQAIGEAPKTGGPALAGKKANSRKGGIKGGAKRMASMTEDERKDKYVLS